MRGEILALKRPSIRFFPPSRDETLGHAAERREIGGHVGRWAEKLATASSRGKGNVKMSTAIPFYFQAYFQEPGLGKESSYDVAGESPPSYLGRSHLCDKT